MFSIMIKNNNLVTLLNELIEINNDRIKGYQLAAAELTKSDIDLRALFRSMANDSKYYVTELTELVRELGGASSNETTNKGKAYQAWMNVKSTFSGHDRQGILDSCEYGEAEAQQAYQNALTSELNLNEEIRSLIATQQTSLKTAHDLIKTFKHAAQAIEA